MPQAPDSATQAPTTCEILGICLRPSLRLFHQRYLQLAALLQRIPIVSHNDHPGKGWTGSRNLCAELDVHFHAVTTGDPAFANRHQPHFAERLEDNTHRCQWRFVSTLPLHWLVRSDNVFAVAGKSTLLQILAGKRLVSQPGTDVKIKNKDVFRQYPEGVQFLGTEWYALFLQPI